MGWQPLIALVVLLVPIPVALALTRPATRLHRPTLETLILRMSIIGVPFVAALVVVWRSLSHLLPTERA